MDFYNYLCILLLGLFLINTGYTQSVTTVIPSEEVFIEDDNNHTWTSLNYPKPYPITNQTTILKVPNGYSIAVFVDDLDLDSGSGDFLLLKGGDKLKDENKGVVFTYTLKSARNYLIEQSSAYLAFQVHGNNTALKKGFSLRYTRKGKEVATTETPTTTILWPTPAAGDHMYLTVNVTGKSQEDFGNDTNLINFKNAIANMAIEYCSKHNISLSQNITIKNIHINTLTRCVYNWPESNMCVKIQLSIPVFLDTNSTLNGYQLSSGNLEQMWRDLADKWLPTVGMLVYQEPHSNSKLVLWLLISGTILICVTLGLFVVKALSRSAFTTAIKHTKRRYSDTKGIVENELKPRKTSLTPHPRQVIPPFFDNDTFFQYEPKMDTAPTDLYFFSDDSDEDVHFSKNRSQTLESKT
ncbi:uncharacterized protein LOC116159794 [Photinus pyralis]|nr:uncharacterized protein LOC116159794 [Photinus pyralis]